MTLSQQNEDFLSANDKTDDTTNDKVKSLFNESDKSEDDTNNTDILINKSDSDTDNNTWLFDNEKQHFFKYYLVEALNLNVKQLQQQQYSLKTQK